jgi:hypothetical protein
MAVGGHNRATRLRTHGRRIYALAWVIEIVAVAAGLAIAMAFGLDAVSTTSDAPLPLEVLLASAGFVIVACAELTKIPVATTLVHAR